MPSLRSTCDLSISAHPPRHLRWSWCHGRPQPRKKHPQSYPFLEKRVPWRCKWLNKFQTVTFYFWKTDIYIYTYLYPTHLDNETCLRTAKIPLAHFPRALFIPDLHGLYHWATNMAGWKLNMFNRKYMFKRSSFPCGMYLISNWGNHCIRNKATSHLPRVCLISS